MCFNKKEKLMKRLFCALILFSSFVSYAAEKQSSSLGGGRKIDLGDTGAKPKRKTSVEHAMRREIGWKEAFLKGENLTEEKKMYHPGGRISDANIAPKN
jgi:hypothetical protein